MSISHPQRVTPIAKHIPEFRTPAPGVPVRSEVRLRAKPRTGAGGGVDGAWWPRSRDPATEFPELVLAMSSWVGPVRRVTYHPDDWQAAAHELTVEGWLVSLVGSSTLQANTVAVVGPGQRRMSLLVVPPSTPGGIARTVLRSATGPGNMSTVEEILANNGIDSGSARASALPPSMSGDFA
ncbi:DUF5994 family protein [Actinophytocola sp.]|uniref:DUF5994 family protein n=1 Tax=Actinophytocola sp. TaxID=1872138 RepID=UPI002ECFBC08